MSSTSKQRRRAAKREAREAIAAMGDDELYTIRAEIGRELELQRRVLREMQGRLDVVKAEIERWETETPHGLHISAGEGRRILIPMMNVDLVRYLNGYLSKTAVQYCRPIHPLPTVGGKGHVVPSSFDIAIALERQ